MTQEEILQHMTKEQWDMATATRLEHKTGWNIMASVTSVNATYLSGILPSEVAEMMELLEGVADTLASDGSTSTAIAREWGPIEEMPVDIWLPVTDGFAWNKCIKSDRGGLFYERSHEGFIPTHFMPLPELPK